MSIAKFNRMSRIRRWWASYLRSNPLALKSPLPEPKTPMLADVANEYEVIVWCGQRINLHKIREKPLFERMNHKQNREVKKNWERMERKGRVKFIEVNGKEICVLNRNYNERSNRKAQNSQ